MNKAYFEWLLTTGMQHDLRYRQYREPAARRGWDAATERALRAIGNIAINESEEGYRACELVRRMIEEDENL